MAGNQKVGKTASIITALRHQYGGFPFSHHFTDWRNDLKLKARQAISRTTRQLLQERAELSDAFRRVIDVYDPDVVVELAAGGSPYGIEYATRWAESNPNRVYIEADQPHMASWKRGKLKEIRAAENIPDNERHIVLECDVLKDDITRVIGPHFPKGKKVLILDEGLTAYFNDPNMAKYTSNVLAASEAFGNCRYLSHDVSPTKIQEALSGWATRAFMWTFRKGIGQDIHPHFDDTETARPFFAQRGHTDFRTLHDVLGPEVMSRYELFGKPHGALPAYLIGRPQETN